MTDLWTWVVAVIGPWVMLGAFGVIALALLVCACAMVEVTRRQHTVSETLVGVVLVVGLVLLTGVCGGIAWSAGLAVILGR